MASLLKVKKTEVHLGVGKIIVHRKWWTIHFFIHLFFFMGGYAKHEMDETNDHYLKQGIIAIAGPIMNVIVCYGMLLFNGWVDVYFFRVVYLFSFWLAIVNLIPFKWNEKASDGYVFFQSLILMMKKEER